MAVRPHKTNLRGVADRFVGRAQELARLEELHGAGERLITVSGPAGTGKTRLADAFARRLLGEYTGAGAGGIWMCDIAETSDLEGICTAVARVLAIPPSPLGSPDALAQRIGDAIAARGPILLVLDNFEQVVEHAAASVGAWLGAAPDLRLVVTSREQLRIRGEVRFELGPLSVPDGDDGIDRADAVALLVERIRALDPAFSLGPATAPQMAALARKLEGIPLAIELAASRVELLGLAGLLEQLDRRLDVLVDTGRDARGRHATLRAAIGWSWDLLDAAERDLLARSSVFRGGFTVEAAHAVCEPRPARPILDLVQSLRDKSLLRRYEPDELPGHVRFALLDTVRDFAEERLDADARAHARTRLAAHVLAQAEAWAADASGPRGADALRLLAVERDNLLAVHAHALASANVEGAIRCALALDAVASVRGPFSAHLVLLAATLAAAEGVAVPRQLGGRLRRAHGKALLLHGRTAGALRELDLALAATEGDDALEAELLADLAVHHHQRREISTARVLYERALMHARRGGARHVEGRVLGNLGALHHDLRDLDRATTFYRDALLLLQEQGDQRLEAIHVANLGVVELEQGRRDRARAHLEAALELLSALGDVRLRAIVLGNLGTLEHEEGAPARARACHERALVHLREAGDRRSEALCLGRLSRAHAALGWLDDAAACLSAAERLLGRHADPLASAAIALDRGFLDCAEARNAAAHGDAKVAMAALAAVRRRIDDAGRPGPSGLSWAEQSDDVRTAVRMLERELEGRTDSSAPAPREGLVVGPQARWFRVPGCEAVDLRRRKALRAMLLRLVEHHRADPGAGLSLESLLEVGWPGERVLPTAAANRVYVALTTLRNLGLRAHLLSRDDGYLLDPALPVERAKGELPEPA